MSEIGEVLRDQAREIDRLTDRIDDWRTELRTEPCETRRHLIAGEISELELKRAVKRRNLDRAFQCPYAIEFG